MKRRKEKSRKGRKLNQWKEDRMAGAVEEFQRQVAQGQEPKLRSLAQAWSVPKSTLQCRVKGLVKGTGHASGKAPLLTKEAESELVNIVKQLAERGFPLEAGDIRRIAFQYAKLNGIAGFSEEKQKAGYYWFEGFMKCNPHISLRKPEAISAARASGMNHVVVDSWFQTYRALLNDLGIQDIAVALEEEVFTTSTFLPDTPNTDAAFIPGPPNTDSAFIPGPLTTSRPTPSNSTSRPTPSNSTSTARPTPSTSTARPTPSTSTARPTPSTSRFADIINLPTRQRGKKRMVVRPPSFHLTSPEHFDFVEARERKKGKKPQNVRRKKSCKPCLQRVQESNTCTVCKGVYGDAADPKAGEEWLGCCKCRKWFHESCAELNGVLDDDEFLCCECV
ncbi:hypothetical protein ACEWY4_010302 [Coilia grayii]|uniref:PHD-type domain-containing protein n=1 Tax=Coilia grayii TaxID=363190 RepID=A0ABD1K1K6_9TELE